MFSWSNWPLQLAAPLVRGEDRIHTTRDGAPKSSHLETENWDKEMKWLIEDQALGFMLALDRSLTETIRLRSCIYYSFPVPLLK